MELTSEKSCCSAGNNQVDEQAGITQHRWQWTRRWQESCPTLCDPRDRGAWQAPLSLGFSRQEYWIGLPFPYPGDFPNPGTEARSPTLQADSLPYQGSPIISYMICYFRIQLFIGDSWLGMGLLIWCGNIFLETSKLKLRLPILCLDF